MVWLIVIGIVALGFVVAAFMSARNLIVPHLLLWLGLFLSTLAFLYASAKVMDTYADWKARIAQVQADTQQALQRRQQLMYGNQSVEYVSSALSTETVAAGQVWTNMVVQNVGANGIVLDARFWGLNRCVGDPEAAGALTPIPDPAATEDEAAAEGAAGGAAPAVRFPPHGLQSGQEVHAFREVPVAQFPEPLREFLFRRRFDWATQGEAEAFYADEARRPYCRLPLVYLGRFRIVGAGQDGTVTLNALGELTPDRLERINQREQGASWALYEKLPLDTHDAFEGSTQQDLLALSEVVMRNVNPARRAGWVSEVENDGKVLQPGQTSPSTQVRVQFVQPHTVEVDAANADPLAAEPFDIVGRTVSPALTAGSPTEFAEGDQVLVDPQTAAQWETAGIANRVEQVGFRLLRDYDQLFRSLARRRQKLGDQLTVAAADKQALEQSENQFQGEQQHLQADIQALNSDQQGLQQQITLLTSQLDQLTGRNRQLRSQLGSSYEQNAVMRQRLAVQQGVAP